jgi:hypothetical protein
MLRLTLALLWYFSALRVVLGAQTRGPIAHSLPRVKMDVRSPHTDHDFVAATSRSSNEKIELLRLTLARLWYFFALRVVPGAQTRGPQMNVDAVSDRAGIESIP